MARLRAREWSQKMAVLEDNNCDKQGGEETEIMLLDTQDAVHRENRH